MSEAFLVHFLPIGVLWGQVGRLSFTGYQATHMWQCSQVRRLEGFLLFAPRPTCSRPREPDLSMESTFLFPLSFSHSSSPSSSSSPPSSRASGVFTSRIRGGRTHSGGLPLPQSSLSSLPSQDLSPQFQLQAWLVQWFSYWVLTLC